MVQLLELTLKLVDQHPGAALLLFGLLLAVTYTQAVTVLRVSYIRRHMVSHESLAATLAEFQRGYDQALLAQANAVKEEFVTRRECALMHTTKPNGGGNGHIHL